MNHKQSHTSTWENAGCVNLHIQHPVMYPWCNVGHRSSFSCARYFNHTSGWIETFHEVAYCSPHGWTLLVQVSTQLADCYGRVSHCINSRLEYVYPDWRNRRHKPDDTHHLNEGVPFESWMRIDSAWQYIKVDTNIFFSYHTSNHVTSKKNGSVPSRCLHKSQQAFEASWRMQSWWRHFARANACYLSQ